MRRTRANDDGSILLLVLGYALLAIAVIFVTVCATDLYIAQKRLDAFADAAALAGADGFTFVVEGDDVRAELTDEGVAAQASELQQAWPHDVTIVRAGTPDGASARVTAASTWHPPLVSPLVPDGVRLESTSTSRTALH